MSGYKCLGNKTIKSHIDAYRRFFDWSVKHGLSSEVLFEGMKIKAKQGNKSERKPFTPIQINQMIDELTDTHSQIARKESHKWASLIGIYTGARLNEICQLEIEDIKFEDNVFYINMTDEGDNNKRLKADASKRKVPIHSRLIGLGLLEFIETRRNKPRLFFDFSYSQANGYGRNQSRWFNETFLPKMGLKSEGLVFHSLRHTVTTRLAQAGVEEPIIQSIIGHARQGVTQAVYMKEGYTLRQMNEAIERLQF